MYLYTKTAKIDSKRQNKLPSDSKAEKISALGSKALKKSNLCFSIALDSLASSIALKMPIRSLYMLLTMQARYFFKKNSKKSDFI